jgi:hypothetical protein
LFRVADGQISEVIEYANPVAARLTLEQLTASNPA